MILTGPEIAREQARGRLTLEPFSKAQLNPNSYNYRLGQELIKLTEPELDMDRAPLATRLLIGEEGMLPYPGHIYLGHTMEEIGSDHFVISLIGRSTMARLGLWLQVTADLGQLGARQRWTLEMCVVQPLRIYPGMEIGQVTSWQAEGKPSRLYRGKYIDDLRVESSKLYRERGAR